MRWSAVLSAALLGCFACREQPAAGRTQPSASAKPPARSESSAMELAVAGLRVRSGALPHENGVWGFSEVGVDLGSVRLEVVHAEHGAFLPKLLPEGALAIVNGGYFETNFAPSTWVKSGGVELAPRRDTHRGGVFAVAGPKVYLGELGALSFEPELAVQSFPLIVEPGGKPGIHRDDGRRAARTVACLRDGQLSFVLLAAPRGEGPTLYEADALLRAQRPRGFGCSAALNLDGGPSSGVVFGPRVGAARSRIPIAPVAYGIALWPR